MHNSFDEIAVLGEIGGQIQRTGGCRDWGPLIDLVGESRQSEELEDELRTGDRDLSGRPQLAPMRAPTGSRPERESRRSWKSPARALECAVVGSPSNVTETLTEVVAGGPGVPNGTAFSWVGVDRPEGTLARISKERETASATYRSGASRALDRHVAGVGTLERGRPPR